MQTEFKLSKERWELFFNNLYKVETLGNNRLFLNEQTTKNFSNSPAMQQYFVDNKEDIEHLTFLYDKRTFNPAKDLALEQSLVEKYCEKFQDVDIYQVKHHLLGEMNLTYLSAHKKIKIDPVKFFKLLSQDGLKPYDFLESYLNEAIKKEYISQNFVEFYLANTPKPSNKIIHLLELMDKNTSACGVFSSRHLDDRIYFLSRLDKSEQSLNYLVGLLDRNSNSTFFNKIVKTSKNYSPELLDKFSHKLEKKSIAIEVADTYITTLKIDPISIEVNKGLGANATTNFLMSLGESIRLIVADKYPATDFSYSKEKFTFMSDSLEQKEKTKELVSHIKDNLSTLLNTYNKNTHLTLNAQNFQNILEKIIFHHSLDESVEQKTTAKARKI